MSLSQSPTKLIDLSLQDQVQAWLASWGFIGNPFEFWEASQEPMLNRYFVRRPFFEQLLTTHKSTLVFAPRGGGKTATRIMVTAECCPAVITSPVLVASFTDFSPFAETHNVLPHLSLSSYLPYLLAPLIRSLLVTIGKGGVLTSESDSETLAQLRFWIEEYASRLLSEQGICNLLSCLVPNLSLEQLRYLSRAIIRQDISQFHESNRVTQFAQLLAALQQVNYMPQPFNHNSPSGIIEEFVQFTLSVLQTDTVKCQNLYILIDGVDEYAISQNTPEASKRLLEPILGNLRLLEISGLSIKFFLPSEQRSEIERVVRTDRVNVITLAWEQDPITESSNQLRQLLRRRIEAFNISGIVSLSELCAPEIKRWIEDAMLEESGVSPRSLLRLGNILLTEHCRDPVNPGSVISPVTWERARAHFRTIINQNPSTTYVSQVVASKATPSIPSLKVDLRTGSVQRGNEELLPLSELEFRLLTFLYQHKGEILSKDEIALAVYEPHYEHVISAEKLGISDETINRLVSRLRHHIEPPGSTEQVYIKTIRGRGYRLDHAI